MCTQTQLLLKMVRLRIRDLSQIKQIGRPRKTRMIRDPIGHSVLSPLFIHNVRTCVSHEQNEFSLKKKKEEDN